MATTTSLSNTFRQGLLAGSYALPTDALKWAMYNGETHNQNTTIYTTTNEASGPGYTAEGLAAAGYAAALDTTNHAAYLDWNDPSWATSTVTATGVMLYNTTVSNHSIYHGDFGGSKSSSAGTFSIVLPAAAYNTAVVRLA